MQARLACAVHWGKVGQVENPSLGQGLLNKVGPELIYSFESWPACAATVKRRVSAFNFTDCLRKKKPTL